MTVRAMPVAAPTKAVTYAEYRALPENGKRYEVLEGELYMTAAPVLNHQRVLRTLLGILDRHIQATKWGEILPAPVELYLDKRNFVEPDIVAVSNARRSILREKNIQGAPDLVIEIISPSTARTDRIRKAKLYAKHQIPHYWIVDYADKTLEAFEWSKGGYVLAAALEEDQVFEPSLFPDFKIPLQTLWH